MAIKLTQGFNITGSSSIDTRFILTKAQMAAMNDNLMPGKYFALCADDNKIYTYDKSRTPTNSETGKFVVLESASDTVIRGYYFNETFYTDSTYTTECTKSTSLIYIDYNSNGELYTWDGTKYNRDIKQATATVAGIVKLYTGPGQNTDGTMTQEAITNGVQSITFNVDLEDEECLILDLPWDDMHGKY